MLALGDAEAGCIAPRLGISVVNGNGATSGVARERAPSRVDLPAFGKPTKPTSATVRSTSERATSCAGRPRVSPSSSASLGANASSSTLSKAAIGSSGTEVRELPLRPLPLPLRPPASRSFRSWLRTHGPPSPPTATMSSCRGATRSPSTLPLLVRTKVPGGTGMRSTSPSRSFTELTPPAAPARVTPPGALPALPLLPICSTSARHRSRAAGRSRRPWESPPRDATSTGRPRRCSRSLSAGSTKSTTLPPAPPPGGSSKSSSDVRLSRGPSPRAGSAITAPSPPLPLRTTTSTSSKYRCLSFSMSSGGALEESRFEGLESPLREAAMSTGWLRSSGRGSTADGTDLPESSCLLRPSGELRRKHMTQAGLIARAAAPQKVTLAS